jgi:hypothetical protein
MLVRTSPKESMGLLNSIKAETEENIFCSFKIISDFKVHMNVIRNNEIYWFSRIYRRAKWSSQLS